MEFTESVVNQYLTDFILPFTRIAALVMMMIGFGAMAPAPEMMMEAAAPAPAMMEEAPAEEAPAEEAMEAPAAEEVAEGENAMAALATAEATEQIAADAEKASPNQESDGIAPTLPASGTPVAAFMATPIIEEMPQPYKAPFFSQWQRILLIVIILFPILAYILRRAVIMKWQKRSK